MKKWMILAVVVMAACSDSGTGLMAPSTPNSTPAGVQSNRQRAIVIRGTVTGTGGQRVSGTSIRVTATPASSNGECSGTPLIFDSSTGTTGEFRSEVRVTDDVTSLCISVTATPPNGSTLRTATVDAGRITPAVVTTGSTIPERRVDLVLN